MTNPQEEDEGEEGGNSEVAGEIKLDPEAEMERRRREEVTQKIDLQKVETKKSDNSRDSVETTVVTDEHNEDKNKIPKEMFDKRRSCEASEGINMKEDPKAITQDEGNTQMASTITLGVQNVTGGTEIGEIEINIQDNNALTEAPDISKVDPKHLEEAEQVCHTLKPENDHTQNTEKSNTLKPEIEHTQKAETPTNTTPHTENTNAVGNTTFQEVMETSEQMNGVAAPDNGAPLLQKQISEMCCVTDRCPMMDEEDPPEEDEDEDESSLPTPPDGGWGWVVVFASFMIHVFADGFTYTLGIFYVHLLSYFGASKAAAAWIVSILVGATLGSGPISGTLVNKFGCRSVTIAGALLASFMLFISIFATNIYMLYLTIGLGAGLGFGLIYLPAIVCVTGYFEKKRSFATGIAVCGSGLGTFVFSPLVEFLIARYNWKGALIVISALVLNCVVFGALFRPLEDTKTNKRRKMSIVYSRRKISKDMPRIDLFERLHEGLTEQIKEKEYTYQIACDLDLRKNFSEANLPVANLPLETQRINSHGNINPMMHNLKSPDAVRMAVSQPVFLKNEVDFQRGDGYIPAKISDSLSTSGPMHRKDIFYSHSLLNIPEYKRNPRTYRESIVRHPIGWEKALKKKHRVCGCVPCSPETHDALDSLMDWGLLGDPVFQLFVLSNFFTSIGFNAPYIFIVDRALDIGIDPEWTSTLLSVVGIANTISRVVLGYISDLPGVNRLYVYNFALTTCGIGTCASIWMTSFKAQCFYAAVFGSMSGAYVGLTSVVLVDLLGMEKLTNAFGLLLLFQGIASVIGPPLCGSLYDSSQNYDNTFLLAGTMIGISGLMLFAIPCVQRWSAKKKYLQKSSAMT